MRESHCLLCFAALIQIDYFEDWAVHWCELVAAELAPEVVPVTCGPATWVWVKMHS